MDEIQPRSQHFLSAMNGRDLLAVLALTVATFGLHWSALRLWWLYDDPYILRVALSNSLWSSLTVPSAYQQLSLVSFTPLLLASFKLDHLLFGFHPTGFYLHQLLLLAVTSWLIYLLLRRSSRLVALWASVLFLACGPAAAVSHLLMTRHYLEGSVFALITVALLTHAESSPFTGWLAAGTYLLACLCKEVYVPLVIAAPLLTSGTVRTRLRNCLPLLLMAPVYIFWRVHMLRGAGLGGYMANWLNPLTKPGFIFSGFGQIAAGLWSVPGTGFISGALLGGLAMAFLAVCWLLIKGKRYDKAVGAILLTGVAFAVIAPVWGGCQSTALISYRLFFHISLLVCVGAGFLAVEARRWSFASARLGKRSRLWTSLGIALWLPVLVFVQEQHNLVQATLNDNWIAHSRENQFYFTQPEHPTLVTTTDGHHWEDLEWIRARLGKGKPPAVCMRPYDLRDEAFEETYACYDPGRDRFHDCTAQFQSDRREWIKTVRTDRGLGVQIDIDRGKYSIRLASPEPAAPYFLLFGAGHDVYWGALQIPPQISGQLYTKPTAFHVRVAQKRSDRLWLLSPEWVLNMATEQTIRWP